MEVPTDVMNCEYFDDLKRKWHSGEVDKTGVRVAFKFLPEGERILAWLDRPIREGAKRNILTLEKFDE